MNLVADGLEVAGTNAIDRHDAIAIDDASGARRTIDDLHAIGRDRLTVNDSRGECP